MTKTEESEEYVVCDICGETVPYYEIEFIKVGYKTLCICEYCLMALEEYSMCDYCLNWFHVGDLIYIEEGAHYCRDCYEIWFNNNIK